MASPGDASRRLPSIILSRKPRFTDSRNETTATAESKDGFTMAVSFWMADPPQLSIFSIHCSRNHDLQHLGTNFKVSPHVVGAEGRFVLLRATFSGRYARSEYFMYKAGDGESPSLERIPSPIDYDFRDRDDLCRVREFGIMLRGHGGHYLLAALCLAPDAPSDYQLRTYSSDRKSWSTTTLHNPCPGVDRIVPEKVITLGEGILGWAELSYSLLECDLRQDPPGVNFMPMPLPLPLPGNRYKLKSYHLDQQKLKAEVPQPGASASWFRDLACVDGVLKFIEMENPAPEKHSDPSDKDIIYDSDLIMSRMRKAVDENSMQLFFRDSWRAVAWSRTVSSNSWRQTCAIDVADILVDESMHSSLLSGLRDETVEQLTFKDLYSAFPILSPDGDDILYLKSLVDPSNRDGWTVAVDVGNKTVKAIGQYYLSDDVYYYRYHDPSLHPFRACTLPRHLDMTPGAPAILQQLR